MASLLQSGWQDTPEAREYLSAVLRRNKRRQFGILEQPSEAGSMTMKLAGSYKILLWGKSGLGKTSTVAKLCGVEVPPVHHETPGIRVSSMYWPAKMLNQPKVIMFQLDFWDIGERACAKFDHLLPACKRNLDAVMFVFSFTDRSSFEDLPHQMSRLLSKDDDVLRLVVGTRFDQFVRSEITEQELRAFAQEFEVPILRIRNINGPRLPDSQGLDGRASLLEIAPLMNAVAECLLRRDQDISERLAGGKGSLLPRIPREPARQPPQERVNNEQARSVPRRTGSTPVPVELDSQPTSSRQSMVAGSMYAVGEANRLLPDEELAAALELDMQRLRSRFSDSSSLQYKRNA